MTARAITGADIFDGSQLWSDRAFLLDGSVFRGIVPMAQIPLDFTPTPVAGGTLLPGFVDLQVNGGGGIMFNDETSVAGLRQMAHAHHRTGTRAFLPTLITDRPARTHAAVDAVEAAVAQGVAGVVGLHLEGPHLSVARKGAHDPTLIRPMTPDDEAFLLKAARRLPNLMVTLAPENATCAQIARLAQAGVIVSLGHSDCSFAQAQAAFQAGARCVTHLFNAMSQLGNREPGLVGACLGTAHVSAGLIADNIHVQAASMGVALRAKRGPGAIFLVTDAMATAGSDITEFQLNGRRVMRRNGRLTLENGTLAGADLDFSTALTVLVEKVGVAPVTAFAMATSGPASLLPQPGSAGAFHVGQAASAILLDATLQYQALTP